MDPGDPTTTEWITIGLTSVLAVTTIVYAWLTRRMAQAMERQAAEERIARRREKSDRAGYNCLDVLLRLKAEMDVRGPSAVTGDTFREAHDVLHGHLAIIDDEVARDRLRATAEVLFVAAFPTDQMERENLIPSRVGLGCHAIVRAAIQVLQSLIAEQPVTASMWQRSDDGCGDEYPSAGTAASWIRCVASRDAV